MSPQAYNNNSYRQLAESQEQAVATNIATISATIGTKTMPNQDELLSSSESALILAALCTLVVSILTVTIL